MSSQLSVMDQEEELGVLADSWMKGSTQCAAALKKANSMLGIIKKGTENKAANIIQKAGKATPGVMQTVLVNAPQKRQSGTGKGAQESNSNDDWGWGPSLMRKGYSIWGS